MEEKFITIKGIETHYWEAGQGDPLILIHGGGAGADGYGNWHHIVGRFAEQGFRVFAYDMLGYGLSARPDPSSFEYSHAARVDQLVQFIDALELNHVSLIGNSMGGATALGVTNQRPEKIYKQVLMGASGRRRAVVDAGALKTLSSYNNEKEQMRKIIRNLTNEQFEISEEMLDYRVKVANDPATSTAYKATMDYLQLNGLFIPDEDLIKIKQKTLIVHGRNDNQVPLDISLQYEKLIENAWLYVIPNCGHWAMIEYPDEFVKLTLDFLKNY